MFFHFDTLFWPLGATSYSPANLALSLPEFIRLQETEEGETRYVATQLGLACLASSLSPDEGSLVAAELQRARKSFVLENELHIMYQVRHRHS